MKCKKCLDSRLVRGLYWWCDKFKIKVDADDDCQGKCRWCGAEKKVPTGLCGNCCRF